MRSDVAQRRKRHASRGGRVEMGPRSSPPSDCPGLHARSLRLQPIVVVRSSVANRGSGRGPCRRVPSRLWIDQPVERFLEAVLMKLRQLATSALRPHSSRIREALGTPGLQVGKSALNRRPRDPGRALHHRHTASTKHLRFGRRPHPPLQLSRERGQRLELGLELRLARHYNGRSHHDSHCKLDLLCQRSARDRTRGRSMSADRLSTLNWIDNLAEPP